MKANFHKLILLCFLVIICLSIDAKKLSRSRGSSRGAGKRTSSSGSAKPASSFSSYSQASAPGPSLSGWQQKPKQTIQKTSQSHSYPSSQTGLSGNSNHNKQQSHSYPASNTGLSGHSGTGSASYPQQQNGGLSGAAAPPPYPGKTGGAYTPNQYGQNHHQQGPPPAYTPNQYGQNHHQQGPPPAYTPNQYGQNHHQQGPPPAYSPPGHSYNSYQHSGYNNYGGYHPGNAPQMPGYFGNYGNHGQGFGGMSRGSSALKGVGIAGAGVGTLLTGLALWNLARSTGHNHHTVIYDRGQPVAVAPGVNNTDDSDILKDLVNCTLTISNGENITEVLAIPCAIATSFRPNEDLKNEGKIDDPNDKTSCTVTIVTKMGNEYMNTIPCSTLLNTAAENNVTETPILASDAIDNINITTAAPPTNKEQPIAQSQTKDSEHLKMSMDCLDGEGEVTRDPTNPCPVSTKLTVIPLETAATTLSSA